MRPSAPMSQPTHCGPKEAQRSPFIDIPLSIVHLNHFYFQVRLRVVQIWFIDHKSPPVQEATCHRTGGVPLPESTMIRFTDVFCELPGLIVLILIK